MIKGGPKIINDGLVLCLDAHDAKSYAGEPTTNILTDPNDFGGSDWNQKSGTFTNNSAIGPRGTLTACKVVATSTDPYCYSNNVHSIAAGSITLSFWVKGEGNTLGKTGDCRFNFSGTATGSDVTTSWGVNLTNEWQKVSVTATATGAGTIKFGIECPNSAVSGDIMYLADPQLEQKSYFTPWVDGTRSATNGWLDRTGNSTGGTLTNMTGTEVSHYRDGQVIMPVANSYLEFDGSDAEVIISQNSAINLSANSPYTLEYWVRFDYLPTTTFVATVMKGSFSTSYGHLFIKNTSDANTTIYVYTDDDSSPELSISRLISTSTWYHIAQTFSSGTAKIYINGELEASTSGLTSTSNTSALRLGSHAGANYFLNGDLAKVNIYNIALTDAQVLQNYNATKERF